MVLIFHCHAFVFISFFMLSFCYYNNFSATTRSSGSHSRDALPVKSVPTHHFRGLRTALQALEPLIIYLTDVLK